VVSEETGAISLATGGRLMRITDAKTLKEMLSARWPARSQGWLQVLNRG